MWVLIGAPVYQRDWILPYWFAAIEAQDFPLDQLGFVFNVSSKDTPTVSLLLDFAERHPEFKCFDIITDDAETHHHHPEGFRSWNALRYKTMAKLRNDLLNRAMCHCPDRYFSLDSDVLLEDPSTITQLFDLTRQHDAVAPLMYMTPEDTSFPNVMTWVPDIERGYRQPTYPLGSLFQADVIMAAVMMSKLVYEQARYQVHSQGEDPGWARDCQSKGFKLYSASFIYAPHIMSRAMLDSYLKNGDPRKKVLG